MEIKLNSGYIFANKKRTSENQPTHKGEVNFGGQIKELALWLKQDKNGNDYFSVKISDPYKGGKDVF